MVFYGFCCSCGVFRSPLLTLVAVIHQCWTNACRWHIYYINIEMIFSSFLRAMHRILRSVHHHNFERKTLKLLWREDRLSFRHFNLISPFYFLATVYSQCSATNLTIRKNIWFVKFQCAFFPFSLIQLRLASCCFLLRTRWTLQCGRSVAF